MAPLLGLLAADYRAQHPDPGGRGLRAGARAAGRFAIDPRLHAVVLVRLVGVAPPIARGALQRTLLWSHAMHVDPRVWIGPGLVFKHPVAIVIGPGARIGAGVTLFHDVSVHDGGVPIGPLVGNHVRMFTGATAVGPVRIGVGALVGAGVAVRSDVEPGGRVVRRHGGPEGTAPLLGARAVPAPPAGRGPLAALRADHAARFGPGRRAPRLPRLAYDALADRGFRVAAIVRLGGRAPGPLWHLTRRLLILHGCDIGRHATFGPGLSVPCPVGVVVGRRSVLGAGVELGEQTCVSPTKLAWDPAGNGLELGDGVQMLPGALAFGATRVGAGAVVAPRALITRDVTAGCRPEPPAPVPAAPAPPARAPFGVLVRSDLARIAGRDRRARRRAMTGLPFQAALLVRLATAGPRPLAPVARAALRAAHHIYVDADVEIGPGLTLPLPCAIRLEGGTRLGANVTVYDRVSLRRAPAAGGGGAGAPHVADEAVVGSGTIALGPAVLHGAVAAGTVAVVGAPEPAGVGDGG